MPAPLRSNVAGCALRWSSRDRRWVTARLQPDGCHAPASDRHRRRGWPLGDPTYGRVRRHAGRRL